jgi:hypothetical protein
MAIHVDLSASQLDPEAVVQFIHQHGRRRPTDNMLFKVTADAFQIHRRQLSDVTAVSPEEARRLDDELGGSGSATEYLVSGGEWRCSRCERYLNFFDVYESGKKHHDNDFFDILFDEGQYHIQLAREASQLDVTCTNCQTINEFKAPLHYSGSIGGSAYSYI